MKIVVCDQGHRGGVTTGDPVNPTSNRRRINPHGHVVGLGRLCQRFPMSKGRRNLRKDPRSFEREVFAGS